MQMECSTNEQKKDRKMTVAHLFVCENEKNSITQLILCQHPHQLLPGFINSLSIITVHHKDQTYQKNQECVWEIELDNIEKSWHCDILLLCGMYCNIKYIKKHKCSTDFARSPSVRKHWRVWSWRLTLCVLEVVSPQGSDLVLATHIPHSKTDVLILHCLHVKAWEKTYTHSENLLHFVFYKNIMDFKS